MNAPFDLLLFSVDPLFIRRAVAAGVAGVMVDWEYRGKDRRQSGADTEINRHTVADLRRVRAATAARVICRINAFGKRTSREVESAIAAGADEIFLPMVRSPREVERTLRVARGRCGVGILIETVAAVKQARSFAELPLSRVYVGLNDLAIERGTPNLFTAVQDGTVERVRRHFSVPFGFGGLTLPEGGRPIPCRLLIHELARLRCNFSFLRRSFHRDMQGRDLAVEVPRLLGAIQASGRCTPQVARKARRDLEEAIRNWQV